MDGRHHRCISSSLSRWITRANIAVIKVKHPCHPITGLWLWVSEATGNRAQWTRSATLRVLARRARTLFLRPLQENQYSNASGGRIAPALSSDISRPTGPTGTIWRGFAGAVTASPSGRFFWIDLAGCQRSADLAYGLAKPVLILYQRHPHVAFAGRSKTTAGADRHVAFLK